MSQITANNKTAILLVNLGSPDAPTPKAVRRYLAEFLWDRRIVDLARPLWWLILHGVILRIRPKRSARAYARIWTADGSPLIHFSRLQATALAERFEGSGIKLGLAMRYGNPSVKQAYRELDAEQLDRLIILPMYPQYSRTTTESVRDAIKASPVKAQLGFIEDYYDHPAYIEACAEHIRSHWAHWGRGERLLFSFHGIPQRFADAGDPYPRHCEQTSALIARQLGLSDDEWMMTYQSRFGREPWLQPYTDKTLEQLPGQGVKKLDIFCPGFAADCLETLEEIAMENRDIFIEAGGEAFSYIPALNDSTVHIDALEKILTEQL
jgi:ferrochelatase